MNERLVSVGLDVGTTTTQLIVSELTVRNEAGAFCVPRMRIADRRVVYQSPVYMTPLLSGELVDGEEIRRILEKEYRKAGLCRESVDTGAVIITGETSRKENARSVMEHLSEYAGDFVVATAGPDLESVLAAKGAGAVEYSRRWGKTVLHMDIGGGTANLALIRDGTVIQTGCLNVGGRLIRVEKGIICYVSPVLKALCDLQVGQKAELSALESVARLLVRGLEMAAGLRPADETLALLTTREAKGAIEPPREETVISFSGGVADCIEKELEPFAYGDMGPLLGRAIRESRLCAGRYRLGEQTIRATVIGAGSHSAQLSGSTVWHKNIAFPLKNIPVLVVSQPEELKHRRGIFDKTPIFAMPGETAPSYARVREYAAAIAEAAGEEPVLVALGQDMAKALGQSLSLLQPDRGVLCIDRVELHDGDYLDVGQPVGPCLPVVVKTLILEKDG